MARPGVPVDPGLLARFRAAAAKVAWRDAPVHGPARRPKARIAHLNDEECRVEMRGAARQPTVVVDAGPLGALLLLMEIDRRGPAKELGAANAGRDPSYPGGALLARWGAGAVPCDTVPSPSDLVELARYALA